MILIEEILKLGAMTCILVFVFYLKTLTTAAGMLFIIE